MTQDSSKKQTTNVNSEVTQHVEHMAGGTVIGSLTQVEEHHHYYATPTTPSTRHHFEPETVTIANGRFLMGDNDIQHAVPLHEVTIPAYAIGIYPVTNEEFAYFIQKMGRLAAKELLWDSNQPSEKQRRLPVTGVSWYEAKAYCDWLSEATKRSYSLPNEAQWEKAARGTDGRFYPWGNQWEPTRCNSDLNQLVAVDAFEAQSTYGCYDMVGNAREWTTTLWGTTPQEPDERYLSPWAADGRDNQAALSVVRRIYRGGRGETAVSFRCAQRGSYLPERPGPRRQRHGFRVVLTLES